MFKLESSYEAAGDQPQAIEQILSSFSKWEKAITLLGATGTGKTFTMANVIQKLQKPTLVISHNKTLAAQLATEFKYFFPNNAVHYFVSYFDYYQPEAYLADKDMYIEKEATINKEIEMYRLGTLASLLTREDVIVVSSVSSLYGLGQKEYFQKHSIYFEVGKEYDRDTIKRQLIAMQYKPMQSKIEPGTFDLRGELLDVYASIENVIYRMHFNEEKLELIEAKDAVSFKPLGNVPKCLIWPSSQYLQDMSDLDNILKAIENEMKIRVDELKKAGKDIEAHRIGKRVMYDIRMIKETGFVNGIENYSIYFDKRQPGESPYTIFDYFPNDMLMIVDESHMSVPQLRAMPEGDKARKGSLIEHGFRLPSAADHRPLNFKELESTLGWEKHNLSNYQDDKIKHNAKTMFVSATPSQYEIDHSSQIVEQIIRPTGLLDPRTYVYPKAGDYDFLMKSLGDLIKKKPHMAKFLKGFELKAEKDLKEVFDNIIDDE